MRIASLAPSVTIMLGELRVRDQMVACTHVCPVPLKERQQLAVGTFSVLDEEKLAAAEPDLVVTATLVQAKGQARLRQAGFNVLHLDPRRLTEIGETYATLGAAVGRAALGEELEQAFSQELAGLSSQEQAAAASRPRVYTEEWHEPPFVSGNWVPDMVRLAGGQPVLSEAGAPSRQVTLAELAAADPDVIVQHVCLPPGRDWTARRAAMVAELMARPGWESLRAVRAGRVYPMDDTPFNTPTRGVLAGVPMLAQILAEAEVATVAA